MDLSAGLARAVPLLQKAPTVRAVAKWNLGRTDAIEGAVAHPAYGHAARVFPGCEVRTDPPRPGYLCRLDGSGGVDAPSAPADTGQGQQCPHPHHAPTFT